MIFRCIRFVVGPYNIHAYAWTYRERLVLLAGFDVAVLVSEFERRMDLMLDNGVITTDDSVWANLTTQGLLDFGE